VLRRYLASGPRDLTAAIVCRRAAGKLAELLAGVPGGLPAFLQCGPRAHRQFGMLAADVAEVCDAFAGTAVKSEPDRFEARAGQAAFRQLVDRCAPTS
jgi:hypothetical protein